MGYRFGQEDERKVESLRLTPQRRAILQVLRHTRLHPDASWIYQQVRAELPHISLGTVYRNLTQLAEQGLIRELDLGGPASRWDGRTEEHDHIVCLRCGRVEDVVIGPLTDRCAEKAAQATGFRVLSHRLYFTGVCADCQRHNRRDEHKALDDGKSFT